MKSTAGRIPLYITLEEYEQLKDGMVIEIPLVRNRALRIGMIYANGKI